MQIINIAVELKHGLLFENFREHVLRFQDSSLHFWYTKMHYQTHFEFKIECEVGKEFYLGCLWQEYKTKHDFINIP